MEKKTLSMEKKTLSMASGVTPQPSNQDEQLNPNLGSNLPVYPAMPRPRQLSAYDPEWEEDPQFSAQARKVRSLDSRQAYYHIDLICRALGWSRRRCFKPASRSCPARQCLRISYRSSRSGRGTKRGKWR